MMNRIAKRLKDREEGFTLIELMVVVLIIAILIAIAIPTFLGARTRAQDRAAQSSLRNALTSAKTIFTDHEDYQEANSTALESVEPSLNFHDGGDSTGQNDVSVDAGGVADNEDEWVGAVLSRSGKCFWIQDQSGSGGPGTTYAVLEDAAACDATSPGAAFDDEW
jgi:type IV pilus assembly protein PilA